MANVLAGYAGQNVGAATKTVQVGSQARPSVGLIFPRGKN